MSRSSELSILLSPWPLKSKDMKMPYYLISFARQAKLHAESPAPWKPKNIGPEFPAIYTGVPFIK